MPVVGYPLGEGAGVVECGVGYWGGGNESGAKGGGGCEFDLERGG